MPAIFDDTCTLYSDGEPMTAIKAYLLRLILCGFFVSLTGAILRSKRSARALSLCGGCLLILVTVRPLLQVDLSRLPDLITGLTRSEREEAAREKNNAILRRLVEEQTAAWIEDKGKELSMKITAFVTAKELESGSFVPDQVTIQGGWTTGEREALSEILSRELEIPPTHQRWVGG